MSPGNSPPPSPVPQANPTRATATLEQVDPKSLVLKPQVRQAIDAVVTAELAQSIRSVGLLQPIVTYRDAGRLVVLDGARRTLACIEAGLTLVPALVDAAPADLADRSLKQLIANVQRFDLSPLEQAEAIAKLMGDRAWTAAQAANAVGKSRATVSKLLSLLTLPEPIREEIAAGTIGLSAGHRLARLADPARQQALAGQLAVAAAGETSRETATVTEAMKVGVDPIASTHPADRTRLTASLDGRRSVTLIGIEPTLDAMVAALETLLTRCRAARRQGLALNTYLRMLRDQAHASSKAHSSPVHLPGARA